MINTSYSNVINKGQEWGEMAGEIIGGAAGELIAYTICAVDLTSRTVYNTGNAVAEKITKYLSSEKHPLPVLAIASATSGVAAVGMFKAYTAGTYVIPALLTLGSASLAVTSGKLLSKAAPQLMNRAHNSLMIEVETELKLSSPFGDFQTF